MGLSQMLCRYCRTRNPAHSAYCARCGNPLAQPTQIGWHRYRMPVALILLATVVGISALQSVFKQGTTTERSAPSSSSVTQSTRSQPIIRTQPVTKELPVTKEIDNATAVASFRTKMMAAPDADKLFLAIEATPVRGVVRIQVTNFWFDFKPHEKRQLTQIIVNNWTQQLQGEPAIVHIYDVTGREIAGTRAFGGIWVEDE
jgi:hypothetical protein